MGTHSVNHAFDNVLVSMEGLNRALEGRVSRLREKGCDAKNLMALTNGVQAMRDSAGIYLAWARHYAQQLDKAEGLVSDEMAEE